MALYHSPRIVTSGMVLYLDAANVKSYPGTGTTWTDLTRNENNGTLVNGPTFSSANGGSLVFNSNNSAYVSYTMKNSAAETIIVWAKCATATWNAYGWISSSRRQNGHIIHPTINDTSVEMFMFSSTTTVRKIGTLYPSDITIPHMYCMTTNGSDSHKIYLDSTFVSEDRVSITRSSSPSAVTNLLGKDDLLPRYANGNIYLALRYNRQLSDEEIKQNYNALKGRFGI